MLLAAISSLRMQSQQSNIASCRPSQACPSYLLKSFTNKGGRWRCGQVPCTRSLRPRSALGRQRPIQVAVSEHASAELHPGPTDTRGERQCTLSEPWMSDLYYFGSKSSQQDLCQILTSFGAPTLYLWISIPFTSIANRGKPFASAGDMTALYGLAGCFSRNAYRDVHIRQSMLIPVPARPVRCQAHKNAEHPQKPDARGIFEMSPPCCEATLLDARCALSGM